MNAPAFFPRTEVAPHRFTVEDVWRMVEVGVIDPDASIEILDGEIIDMPSEGEVHLTFKMRLNRLLVTTIASEWEVMPEGTLHLAPQDAPQPDFYVLPADADLRPVDPAGVALIIEIADMSLRHDLGRKPGKYAQYGLSEYWVIDVNARQTHVHRNPVDGAYADVAIVPFDEPLTPARLDMIIVRLDQLVPAKT
ncbi:Uma2 family endonuclease [Brevundimonas sp.]|uniref:Uma2 family endonuclease n=1 Tax=Brevundimonas sp. TaxID=1871086 RepID=UPI002ABAB677|nr:Uma2 family endonuclease [Brevundimonas sp.]MDZ4363602.1 Uma2 family endonuclease [Brevundimonas sp.]